VSDIWRSYVSQRLLWDVGYVVAFAPPMAHQFRSPHNYLGDMQVSTLIVPSVYTQACSVHTQDVALRAAVLHLQGMPAARLQK
jgi:hypothetical protein